MNYKHHNSPGQNSVYQFVTEQDTDTLKEDLKNINYTSKKPFLIFLGPGRCGKSSIISTLFHSASGNDCLFIKNTMKIHQEYICSSPFIQINIIDFPGYVDIFQDEYDSKELFYNISSVIYVIDLQENLTESMRKLDIAIKAIITYNRKICFEIFMHKMDCIPEDFRVGQRYHQIFRMKFNELLNDNVFTGIAIRFHMTSIYDSSLNENLLIESHSLERLLTKFCSFEKVFLFDVNTKMFIACDSSPHDMQTFELCCDFIDMFIDFMGFYKIYSYKNTENPDNSFDISGNNSFSSSFMNKKVICMFEVDPTLMIVALMRKKVHDNISVLRYNMHVFVKAIKKLLPDLALDHPLLFICENRLKLQNLGEIDNNIISNCLSQGAKTKHNYNLLFGGTTDSTVDCLNKRDSNSSAFDC